VDARVVTATLMPRRGFRGKEKPAVNHDNPASVNLSSGIFDYALGNKNGGDKHEDDRQAF
jgi:hypothetical protein